MKNMRTLTREELKRLMEWRGGLCVSVFMPTHRVDPKALEQDPIRLKNLLREAENQLVGHGMRAAEARAMLDQAAHLYEDREFLEHQGDGLALFLAQDFFQYHRLPLTFDERVTARDRFHIKPLVPLLAEEGLFYTLALSQHNIRLFQCSRYSVREMPLPDIPRTLEEALKYDDPESQLQFHSGSQPASPTGERRPAMFHGQGGGIDDQKNAIERFFRVVDKGLWAMLHDERVPLVPVGVEYELPIYRAVNSYPVLLDGVAQGKPEAVHPDQLHEAAWKVVQPYFERAKEEARERYVQLGGTGRVSNDVRDIVPAAQQGRVDSLFMTPDVEVWGVVDEFGTVGQLQEECKAGTEDLLDLAVIHTLSKNGAVYVSRPDEMPSGTPIAAVYRY